MLKAGRKFERDNVPLSGFKAMLSADNDTRVAFEVPHVSRCAGHLAARVLACVDFFFAHSNLLAGVVNPSGSEMTNLLSAHFPMDSFKDQTVSLC